MGVHQECFVHEEDRNCPIGSISRSAAAALPQASEEKIGQVSFPTSCASELQPCFDRAVALLHSFWYEAAEASFRAIALGGATPGEQGCIDAVSKFFIGPEPPEYPARLEVSADSEFKQLPY